MFAMCVVYQVICHKEQNVMAMILAIRKYDQKKQTNNYSKEKRENRIKGLTCDYGFNHHHLY